MKAILKKLEYILLTLFVLFLSQIPFIFIRQMTASEKNFSAGQTIFVLVVYLLIIFFVLRMAKQEELLSLDFSFFKWSSFGWLAVSNVVMIGVNMLGAIIMLLEGQAISTANQDALNALFQHVPKILLVVGAVIRSYLGGSSLSRLDSSENFYQALCLGIGCRSHSFRSFSWPDQYRQFCYICRYGCCFSCGCLYI